MVVSIRRSWWCHQHMQHKHMPAHTHASTCQHIHTHAKAPQHRIIMYVYRSHHLRRRERGRDGRLLVKEGEGVQVSVGVGGVWAGAGYGGSEIGTAPVGVVWRWWCNVRTIRGKQPHRSTPAPAPAPHHTCTTPAPRRTTPHHAAHAAPRRTAPHHTRTTPRRTTLHCNRTCEQQSCCCLPQASPSTPCPVASSKQQAATHANACNV